MELHVGRGTSRGALTVFPVWSDRKGPRGYSSDLGKVALSELEDGPSVGHLLATNSGRRPRLMLEGTVLEGGWQHRMLLRSVLVPGQQELRVPVACVEQGRWGGGRAHAARSRRASVRVRSASRQQDVQGEVWSRVAEYDGRFGANATGSFVGHLESAEDRARELVRGLEPLDGQCGVVVAIAGQPAMLEAFDSPRVLARQLESILFAAAMDALDQPEVVTPSRRARRFVERVERVRRTDEAPAGAGTHQVGASEHAGVTALSWHGRDVHLAATNPRQALVGAA
jgi:hypothetical protein